MLCAEGQDPGGGQDRQRRGRGEQHGQQAARVGGRRHRDQHPEIEETARGAECQGEEHPEQECAPAALARQLFAAAVEAERGEPEPVAEEHERADEQQRRTDERRSVAADEPLDAEQARPLAEQRNERHAQSRVGHDASERVEQAVSEHPPPVSDLPADESHGGDVRRQRAGREGREQAQKKGRQSRCRAVVQQCL